MFTAGVVKTIDGLKEGVGDVVSDCPRVPPNQFGLEGFENGLDGSIVVTVAIAAHRYLEAHFPQPFLIFMGTILAATIGVVKAALRWVSERHSIVQGLQSQVDFEAIAGCPANHSA